MTVLDGSGAVVATQADKAERSFLRVARLGEDLLVQVGDGSDAASIWRVTPEGPAQLVPVGFFAVQPPSVCRENCLEPFPNPGAPVWQ